jgi:hypothetical protein
MRACLGEIDRCRAQNVNPFFLNLLGQRYGWIPDPSGTSERVDKFIVAFS